MCFRLLRKPRLAPFGELHIDFGEQHIAFDELQIEFGKLRPARPLLGDFFCPTSKIRNQKSELRNPISKTLNTPAVRSLEIPSVVPILAFDEVGTLVLFEPADVVNSSLAVKGEPGVGTDDFRCKKAATSNSAR